MLSMMRLSAPAEPILKSPPDPAALEGYETPLEATEALLEAELFTGDVWDPACGQGHMAAALAGYGYDVVLTDIADWGAGTRQDFLTAEHLLADSIVVNPPFSLADAFVERALALGVRKLAVFQRFAWWESAGRAKGIWQRHPPNRVYGFDKRVTCWRFDVPPEERARRSNTPTAHAWFIWERGHPPGPVLGHLILPDRRKARAPK